MKSNKELISSNFKKRIAELGGVVDPEHVVMNRDVAVLLGELHVAQIELEMQNDELSLSAQLLENERSKFAGFFNLAPVAYFILDQLGRIIEVNQIGQTLLAVSKKNILNQRFQSFISTDDWDGFYNFQKSLKPEEGKRSIEIKLQLIGGVDIFARIEGIAILNGYTNELQYYVAVIDVTKTKLIAQAAKDLGEEKHKLILATSFKAQEKERLKISSVLHDSICQLLYGIRLNLQHLQLNHKEIELHNVNQLIAQAIKEVRDLSYELTPSVLRDFGFVAGIKEMIERLSTPLFKINFKVDEATNQLKEEIQLSVFRMIQELLNNAIKHAKATKVDLIVKWENDELCIFVRDNGIGFDGDIEKAFTKGSGLRGIKNRVSLLNGEFFLRCLKKGLEITIKFKNEKPV